MVRSGILRLHPIRTLFNFRHPYPQNPNPLAQTHLISSIHSKSLRPSSIFSRGISLSSLFQQESATQEANMKLKKPVEPLFTEATGLPKSDIDDGEDENEKLKRSLEMLEVELRSYSNDSTKRTKTLSGMLSKPLETIFTEVVGLHEGKYDVQESNTGLKEISNLFTSSDQREKSKRQFKKTEEPMEFKELSPDMAIFATHLHTKGYLINANFLPNNKFDVSCFVNNYGRDFLKYAAEKFAMDHREIYKWLPNDDLKKVAQFGCPSIGRKNVFSAKAMRFCFGIQEETVCNKCTLKESCKFVNQSVWKKGAKNMDLTVVMRVITLYALDAVPTQLEVPDDVKNAVNRLLKEVIRLSELET